LKGQAQELVQVVSVFRLSSDGSTHVVSAPAPVRSTKPKEQPFAGVERRNVGVAKGAAARGKAAPVPPRPAASPAASAPASAPKPSPAPAPAGGDDDWTTF
jgi:hypothetical protein